MTHSLRGSCLSRAMQAMLNHKHCVDHVYDVDHVNHHCLRPFVLWVEELIDKISGDETATSSPSKVNNEDNQESGDVGVEFLADV